jgi:hypothetical protein
MMEAVILNEEEEFHEDIRNTGDKIALPKDFEGDMNEVIVKASPILTYRSLRI